MLSIGKLAHGQESYYLDAVANGAEDYYLGSGEAAGYWTGAGAQLLGLSGEVAPDDLRAVLAGRDPVTDAQLVRAGTAKRPRVPGFDLTFSAPKSVSVLYALGTPKAAQAVVRAHEVAVEAALTYLESHATFTRRRRDGVVEEIPAEGLTVAAFRHRSSRAGDPQLHTHCVTAGMVRGVDGRWGSLDARWLYAEGRTAGFVYQAVLRGELTADLGLAWGEVRNGYAEIDGVDRQLLRMYSQRRVAIERELDDVGLHSAAAAQAATLGTRRTKDYGVDPESLRDRWLLRAREAGFDPGALEGVIGGQKHPSHVDIEATTQKLLSPEGLTRRTASFDRAQAVRAWCEAFAGATARVETLEALTDTLLAADGVVHLRGSEPSTVLRSDGHVIAAVPDRRRFTTTEMLAVEESVTEGTADRTDAGAGLVHTALVEAVLASRPELEGELAEMVKHITTSGAGVDVVPGKAGAGKTSALAAAATAWELAGFRVSGVALAARAAAQMEAGAGIPSTTLARFLNDLERPEVELGPNQVVVVEEAGMVDTRQLDRVLTHAARANAKVVLIGDYRQLPELEAGGAFRALAQRLEATELRENRRQHEGWERAALDELREGDVESALTAYRVRDRVVTAPTAMDAREAMVDAWYAARAAGEQAVMVAISNRDVDHLNEGARAARRAAGELGEDELAAGDRSFAVGDEIMCVRNDRLVGVINGTMATVLDVDAHNRSLVVELQGGGRRVIPTDYLDAGNVTHAYATTIHKAQGLTVDRTFLLGDDRLYREAGYVGLSRGRRSNHLYVVHHDRDEALELHAVDRDPPEPVDEVLAALERSAAKHLASEERARASTALNALPAEVGLRHLDRVDGELAGRLEAARRERAEVETELATALGEHERARAERRLEVVGRHEGWLAGLIPQDQVGPPAPDDHLIPETDGMDVSL